MDKAAIYAVFQSAANSVADSGNGMNPLPPEMDETARISSFGIDEVVFSDILDEMENRFGNRSLQLRRYLNPTGFQTLTLGTLVSQVEKDLDSKVKNPIVVYVDDEEENLFVFKRKFGKTLNLVTFSDPRKALEFVKTNSAVGLVITDEVMPGLNGNGLCDEVHKVKPFMRFILITGNPDNDSDLLHKSLRGNRFFEFISKPLDLERSGEKYLRIIREAMG